MRDWTLKLEFLHLPVRKIIINPFNKCVLSTYSMPATGLKWGLSKIWDVRSLTKGLIKHPTNITTRRKGRRRNCHCLQVLILTYVISSHLELFNMHWLIPVFLSLSSSKDSPKLPSSPESLLSDSRTLCSDLFLIPTQLFHEKLHQGK